jgi:hypothetical protein
VARITDRNGRTVFKVNRDGTSTIYIYETDEARRFGDFPVERGRSYTSADGKLPGSDLFIIRIIGTEKVTGFAWKGTQDVQTLEGWQQGIQGFVSDLDRIGQESGQAIPGQQPPVNLRDEFRHGLDDILQLIHKNEIGEAVVYSQRWQRLYATDRESVQTLAQRADVLSREQKQRLAAVESGIGPLLKQLRQSQGRLLRRIRWDFANTPSELDRRMYEVERNLGDVVKAVSEEVSRREAEKQLQSEVAAAKLRAYLFLGVLFGGLLILALLALRRSK